MQYPSNVEKSLGAIWWRGTPTRESCGTVPLEEVLSDVLQNKQRCICKNKQTFCPLMWLLEQCCSCSRWWNSRRWVCRWRQQLSLRWFTIQGDVWTEMSNANTGAAENQRKLRWIRAFNRYGITGTRIENVLWCYQHLVLHAVVANKGHLLI